MEWVLVAVMLIAKLAFWGACLFAAVLIMLPQALTSFQDYEHLLLGFLIIVSMIFMRDGIVPMLAKLMERRA